MKIPMFIQRCLTYGIQIYPYQLSSILEKETIYSIPDEIIIKFKEDEIRQYINGLYLSSMYAACDWGKGLEILKNLGFTETKTEQGHRSFVTLNYTNS